ncbi:MAG: proline--tRNA ligase [Candidatus Pacebacteria bacterium]|nr:proline--tRNA ligase [Candidatus Paceibacterota bacterium]PIR60613.1 MAG: proline--tRNA ligase [Candidatus Pacebacteria bacterium CG10_big_fil_rev_8_21_14_0_10_44_54]
MKYSKLFGKATFDESKDSKFASYNLLIKGGFIRESSAGRFFFLPLGWRVHEKMKAIIKAEMDKTGAQEMLVPTLHPLALWEETNRTNSVGFELMKVEDRNGSAFALGGTAEEMFVDIVRKLRLSHKDLPVNLYQFSNKFRDELRARGGLLRVREFIMKDAYSFHTCEEDFLREYKNMAEAYKRMYEKMGLEVLQVAADNGYIGGEYCHEFQVESELGEGRFFVSADGKYSAHEDIAQFKRETINPDEKIRALQIIEQPSWVKTMEDNIKHYGKDKCYFLKNVVYKTQEGDIVIATIRGDLEVNEVKLLHVLNNNTKEIFVSLEAATIEDLALLGTKPGYVHSWGHKFLKQTKTKSGKRNRQVLYVADLSLGTVVNFIGGQKEDRTDSINVNYGKDFTHDIEGDIAMAQPGFKTKDGKSTLVEKRGIEVGNIFQLGYHYSKKMQSATFTSETGEQKPFYMGCYGFGIGRTMATVVEKHHDEHGIIWPASIAPYQAHLVSLAGVENEAAEVFAKLQAAGVEVLWDDRSESAGVKFSDADLLGIPHRLIVSKKTDGKLEWKARGSDTSQLISFEEVCNRCKNT